MFVMASVVAFAFTTDVLQEPGIDVVANVAKPVTDYAYHLPRVGVG